MTNNIEDATTDRRSEADTLKLQSPQTHTSFKGDLEAGQSVQIYVDDQHSLGMELASIGLHLGTLIQVHDGNEVFLKNLETHKCQEIKPGVRYFIGQDGLQILGEGAKVLDEDFVHKNVKDFVSRRHLEFSIQPRARGFIVEVRNLSATNGTFLKTYGNCNFRASSGARFEIHETLNLDAPATKPNPSASFQPALKFRPEVQIVDISREAVNLHLSRTKMVELYLKANQTGQESKRFGTLQLRNGDVYFVGASGNTIRLDPGREILLGAHAYGNFMSEDVAPYQCHVRVDNAQQGSAAVRLADGINSYSTQYRMLSF